MQIYLLEQYVMVRFVTDQTISNVAGAKPGQRGSTVQCFRCYITVFDKI